MHLRAAIVLLVIPLFGGCGNDLPEGSAEGVTQLSVWFHSGREAERRTIKAQVERFNALDPAVQVELTLVPEGAYRGQVKAAALAGELPDVLEFDGPFVYNYAWQGRLIPLEDHLPQALRDDLLPSIIAQGTYQGRLYSVGTFDSGLGIWGRRSRLEAVGARIPGSPAEAWTAEELDQILSALAARHDDDGAVLDLKLNYTGEWFSYGFSPAIQSAGGDLIDRQTLRSAKGRLDGPAAVAAMERIQRWIQKGLVDPNLDDAAFVAGRVALSWVGHWEYGRYQEAVGDDLVLLPLPDFGKGSRSAQGSWNWGITSDCPSPQAAARFLAFLFRPEEVLAMADANGAVPATRTAIARSTLYGPGGPLRLYAMQLEGGHTLPRPRTPAYPVITTAFDRAFQAIRDGAPVGEALAEAARTIDQDIEDNQGYPPVAPVR